MPSPGSTLSRRLVRGLRQAPDSRQALPRSRRTQVPGEACAREGPGEPEECRADSTTDRAANSGSRCELPVNTAWPAECSGTHGHRQEIAHHQRGIHRDPCPRRVAGLHAAGQRSRAEIQVRDAIMEPTPRSHPWANPPPMAQQCGDRCSPGPVGVDVSQHAHLQRNGPVAMRTCVRTHGCLEDAPAREHRRGDGRLSHEDRPARPKRRARITHGASLSRKRDGRAKNHAQGQQVPWARAMYSHAGPQGLRLTPSVRTMCRRLREAHWVCPGPWCPIASPLKGP